VPAMGKIRLVFRLAARDLWRHPAEAVLTLLAISAATTILTLGLVLHGVTSQPYQQTRAATHGPDEVTYFTGDGGPGQRVITGTRLQAAVRAQVSQLLRAPGVTGHSGPYPLVGALVRARGRIAGAEAEGRTEAPAAVDQPKVTQGSWVRPGGVVLERTFAEALGVRAGDRITLNGRPFRVAGIAVSAAFAPYPDLCLTGAGGCWAGPDVPASDMGVLWLTEPDARGLATPANPLTSYVENLTLRHPASAPAFASRYSRPGLGTPSLTPWQGISTADAATVQAEEQVLNPGAWLAGLLAVASVAVLAGGRMAEATRRVGLLKAVGGTPGLVTAVLMAKNLAVALAAAGIGLVTGWLAAPLLTSPGASLVGTPGPPSFSGPVVGLVVAVALAVALASTLVPAIRAARTSTVSALADAPRPPRRRAALIIVSAWLPVPLLLGLRLIGRRTRRALLTAASTTVTASALVAVLVFHATASQRITGGGSGLNNPIYDRVEQVLLILTIALVALAALNAVFTAWATVLDTRQPAALARSLGATPEQISAGLSVAQLLPALPGALLGIPLGIVLFKAASGGGVMAIPPVWWLVVTVLGILAGLAVLTSIPARIGARQPVAEVLQAELA
jgi:ABC-type lipoprotein release transport system permease subunit